MEEEDEAKEEEKRRRKKRNVKRARSFYTRAIPPEHAQWSLPGMTSPLM